ncbi:hypothetical protein ACFSY7_04625 [Kurthia populi]|uniref:Internalin I Ig-like domain-containing protein n=1 Tax=Kurthia populi TaxID=1562132 RepID=A0ABW5XXN9_9BACL
MANAKFVKTAAAVALGASVVTTAVAPGVASAATKYKVNSKGNLVLKSTGSLVKGWVEFGGKLYKNGKPAPAKKYKIMGTGASMKLYFGPTLKKGYKTANSKSLLFKDGKLLKGNKQTADRTRYYENGKLATGWDVVAADETKYIYKSGKLFKEQKTATRDGVLNYFENGKLAEGTKAFQDTLFTDGTVDEKDQVFKDVLYVGGKKAEGTVTFEDVVYVDGVKDTEKPEITAEDKTVEYGSEAVDVATLATVKDNSGEEIKAEAKISFDGKAVEKIDTKTPGVYTVTFTAKDKNGNEAEAKEVKVTVAEAAKAEVESVTAINGTQIKVTFNKSIDASTVIGTSDALKNITVAKVGSSAETGLKATLSDDKKSVTITSTGALNGEYNVAVTDAVKTTAGDKVEASTKLIKIEDKVAPTYVGFTKENASTFLFNFSEPINDLGSVVVKKADGTVLTTPNATVSKDGSTIKVVLGADVEAGKDITVSFAGQTDATTNVLETPFSVTIQKGAKDGVAPEVTSVTPVNTKKFEIKLSEEVQGFGLSNVTVNGGAVKSVTQDKADKTKYIVELNSAVSGLTTVAVTDAYADLSGEQGKAFSQIVNFAADTVKPTATAALSVNKDGNQVLTFTTSEDTTLAKTGTITLPAKAVKNYVTTSGDITLDATDLKAVEGSSTQYTVELSKVKFANNPLVKDTTYTVDLVADVFADVAGNKNEAKKDAFTFTRGADKDAAKPAVVSVSDNNLDSFTVDFGKTVELDNSTVVNKANYYVAGATIDSVTLDANNVATVKLVSGSNNYTGKRTVKVTGIKAANGNVMDDFTTTKSFNENVKPTVLSAKVDDVVKATAEVKAKNADVEVDNKKATASYTGTQNGTATFTYSESTSTWKQTSGDTFTGLTVSTAAQATPTDSEKAIVTTTNGVKAVAATTGKTTVKVTLSEEVKAVTTDYVVNVDGKKVEGVKATVTPTTANSKEVTIVIDKELTADDFAKGVTLTAADYELTDGAGNKADIPAAGIKVSL